LSSILFNRNINRKKLIIVHRNSAVLICNPAKSSNQISSLQRLI